MKVWKQIGSVGISLAMFFSILSTNQVYAEEPVYTDPNVQDETQMDETTDTDTGDIVTDETDSNPEQPVDETENQPPTDQTDTDESVSNSVTDWQWNDPDGNLTYSDENQRWELNVPGASEENPLTQDALSSMLPTQITVTLSDGQQVVLDITWDLSSIPAEGVWEDELSITATINDPNYASLEGLSALQLALVLGEADTMSIPTGTIDSAPFQNHIIDNNTDATGTTVNLFDYWLYERNTEDSNDNGNVTNRGINKGHALNFRDSGGNDVEGDWNNYTNSSNPRQGIVASNLDNNGYPVLNNLKVPQGYDRDESLQYLFDPNVKHDGKISYSDVDGLLRVDDDGYFNYSSDSNYAVFYPGSNAFALYDKPGAVTNITGTRRGEFFPFDSADEVFNDYGGELHDNDSGYENGKNHYFGLTMSTRFIQQYGGHTSENARTAVTYEFSGDDDVWVFIDDVLVADLGGIHGAGDLSINFATGVVKVQGQSNTTIREQFSRARASLDGFDGNTFKDDTYHTLKFFYLERGNGASNMSLKFNLVTVPESDIIKVDQLGDPVPGATFDLYAATDDSYQYLGEKIATGTTGTDGSFIIVDDEGYTISLNDLYNNRNIRYMVLKETSVPSGYRSFGEMHLELYNGNGNVVLLSDNHWKTGAYSSAKLTAKAPNSVTEQYPITNGRGIMFAVAMKYVGNGTPNPSSLQDLEQWRPIYGDPVKEDWHVASDSTKQSILNAAKSNPYIFQVDSSGAYKVEIENMPGNIRNYYFMSAEKTNVQYVVMYFYASGVTSLDQIRNADSIVFIPESGDNNNDFSREFAARLYVPNIKNNLLIQKVDEAGNPVVDAKFTLTNNDPNAQFTPIVVTTSDLTKDPQTGKGVNLKGGAIIEGIPIGNYTLTETLAPNGYEINSTPIDVVVDNTGVYANAGAQEDGVDVLRGVGSIVKTMVQFATNDSLNTTLHDIKATLYTNESYTTDSSEWTNQNEEIHLQYDAEGAALEYGPAPNEDKLAFTTTSGWSKLNIQQCLDHDSGEIEADKEDIKGTDITNLFSGSVTVRVENKRVGTLSISKTVVDESNIEPEDASYTFNLHATTVDDSTPLVGNYNFEKYDINQNKSDGQVTFDANGDASISLKHGERITFTNLPEGSLIDVHENNDNANFTTSYTVNSGNSNVGDGQDDLQISNQIGVNIKFINTYEKTSPFGFLKMHGDNEYLEGASFVVYELVCSDSSHNHSDDINVDENGDIIGDNTCWKQGSKVTSSSGGEVIFENLNKKSEYRLIEYKAPDGYLLPNGQWKLAFNEETNRFEITGSTNTDGTYAFSKLEDGSGEKQGIYYKVENYKPGELPLTGSKGITLFLLVGSSLMLLGGIIYIFRRKRSVI